LYICLTIDFVDFLFLNTPRLNMINW